MEKELTYYWHEDNAADGLKFKLDKAYTLAEIDKILKDNRTWKINGFFIHYGTMGRADFSRRIIQSLEDNKYLMKRSFFNTVNFEQDKEGSSEKIVTDLLELEIDLDADDKFNRTYGISKKFGL